MAESFGEIVRQARMQRGWDQAELARRLGSVRQQTVSRWENGASRPRRATIAQLADLLSLDVAVLLPAAGYLGATADRHAEVRPPVRPLLEKLPFDELSPDDFEQFSTELAKALHPQASSVSRNGAQGSRQDGVDVIIRYGDAKPDGIQCKREKQFGPTKVAKAVGELRMDVGRCFIYLSRVATADARKEIAKYPRWELLDAKDLSSEIRNLKDRDASLRLVDTYFPGYREPFLGVRAPGPWLTCDEFFRSTSSDRIYTHRWQLFGRSEQLAHCWLSQQAASRSLPYSPAGAASAKVGLSESLPSPESVAEQPPSASSHGTPRSARRILSNSRQARDWWSLLTTAPRVRRSSASSTEYSEPGRTRRSSCRCARSNWPHLPPAWARPGFTHRNLNAGTWTICRMSKPRRSPAQALGPDVNPALAGRLAGVGRDCPLLIVVGAALIGRGKLDPARLESGDPLRSEIMAAFRKALTGDPGEGDPETRQEILKGIAALQPFRLDQPAFRSALEGLTGRAFDQLMPHMRPSRGRGGAELAAGPRSGSSPTC